MWIYLIGIILAVGLYLKLLFRQKKKFWSKYGIRMIDPSKVISSWEVFTGRKALVEADDYIYHELGSDKFCGKVEMGQPFIFIKDLDLAKRILIKDFDYFVDRRNFFQKEDGSLHKTLLSLEGDEWKGVRASVSPTFTTGKIRRMMECINSIGKDWVDEYSRKARASQQGSVKIDALKSVNLYTVDVIASAVFGMQAGTVRNPDSIFSKMANRLSDITPTMLIKFGLRMRFPGIRLKMFDQEALTFFETILDQGLKQRLSGEVKRNDFLQLLVEAKKGELKAAGSDELNEFERDAQITGTEKKQYLTDEIMNAQSVVFFFAGFSTTSNFITFSLYALALHPDIQTKLRQEVGKIAKNDGTFDYDELNQLVYLDMVICEVLRKFPAAGRLERRCVREYRDEKLGLVIPKYVTVAVPIYSIHLDKQYYDNPDKFDPEHFAPEKKASRNPYAFMPFGSGPRNCIGMRFALTESKAAVAHIVHGFLIEPTDKTPTPLQGKPAGLQYIPPKGLELKLTPLRT